MTPIIELTEALERATPGPWRINVFGPRDNEQARLCHDDLTGSLTREDGELIVLMRNTMPALLAHIHAEPERLAAAVAMEQERCARIADDLFADPNWHPFMKLGTHNAATAIRSGENHG